MSKTIKKVRDKMKKEGVNENEGWLKLGTKKEGGGVKSTGKHTLILAKEPKIIEGQHYHTGVKRQELIFVVNENGENKKWSVPLYKLNAEGKAILGDNGKPIEYYLLNDLEQIDVGDKFELEMKSSGKKNYIEVNYPIEGSDEEDIDIEDLGDEEDIDIDNF